MSLLGSIGNGLSSAAHLASNVGDAIKNVGEAVEDFKKGDIAGGLQNVGEALGDLGEAVGDGLDLVQVAPSPGDLAAALADSVLPEDFDFLAESFGASVDFTTGNHLGAARHGLAAAKEAMEYAFSSSEAAEPSAPPSLGAPGETPHDSTGSTKADWRGTPPTPVSSAGLSDLQDVIGSVPGDAPAKPLSVDETGNSGAIDEPSQQNEADETGRTSGASEPRGPASSDGATNAKDWIASFSNSEELMKAVQSGDIPQEILDSPGGMMILQAKINQIQKMNELMTSMMKAMHEMQMSIVHNIRA